MKIKQLTSYPIPNEIGLGNTNESYIRVENNLDVSDVFPPNVEVLVKDCISGKSYKLKSKTGTEFRINQLGQIYRDYDFCPGDEIKFTQIDDNGKKTVFFSITKYNRVFLNVGAKGTEIVNIERLEKFLSAPGTKEYIIKVDEGVLKLSFDKAEKKRTDSPTATDFYITTVNGVNIDKGTYYISIDNRKNTLEKEEKNRIEEYDIQNNSDKEKSQCLMALLPLQQIFYGAPGTGKSHTIKELTKGDDTVVRTTFHPDSDYSTFVGTYKPIQKENEQLRQVVSDFTSRNAISILVVDQDGKPVVDKSITYKFVKQAFLKAYILAWKKMSKAKNKMSAASLVTSSTKSTPAVPTVTSISFPIKGIIYDVKHVSNDRILIDRNFDVSKSSVESVWNLLWSSGSFVIPTGSQPGRSVQIAICRWIYDNLASATQASFNDGWDLLIDSLKGGNSVTVCVADTNNAQVYTVTKFDNSNDLVHMTNESSSRHDRLRKCFDGEKKPKGVEIGLTKILKDFNPDDFDDAWSKLMDATINGSKEYPEILDDVFEEPKDENGWEFIRQYLIIEEINRGNCAQIFGDIFQLLDRNDWGFSTYPITADEDLRKELREEFNELNLDDVKDYVDSIFEENYPDGIVEKIKNGEVLVLPCNLYIWATMNTSDQSLFPIDSAFKRRWDWEYVPIKRADKEPENKWIIKVTHGGKTYWCYWWEFLEAINHQIEETTHSEDKQLGYFFAKPKNEENFISTDTFVNKVIFYLWNDVFKDEDSAVFQYDNDKVEDVSINRSGTMYFRHFMENKDEMIHYFINQLFAMGKDSTPVVPIDYLKNDANSNVIEHLPKMREYEEEDSTSEESSEDNAADADDKTE